MSTEGWVKIYRSLNDWEYKTKPNYVAVWIHLLINVNHKTRKYLGDTIEAGSLTTSVSCLCSACGLSVQQVRTILNKLKSTNYITIEADNKRTKISIVNWDKFQAKEQSEQQSTNKQATNDQQSNNNQITTNKNEKNVKNEKNERNNSFDFENNLKRKPELSALIFYWNKQLVPKGKQPINNMLITGGEAKAICENIKNFPIEQIEKQINSLESWDFNNRINFKLFSNKQSFLSLMRGDWTKSKTDIGSSENKLRRSVIDKALSSGAQRVSDIPEDVGLNELEKDFLKSQGLNNLNSVKEFERNRRISEYKAV